MNKHLCANRLPQVGFGENNPFHPPSRRDEFLRGEGWIRPGGDYRGTDRVRRDRAANGRVAFGRGRSGPVWPGQGWAEGACAGADPIWLLIEERSDGQIQYAFSNLPPRTGRIKAVRLWKSRWPVEQGYQQMKEELGLNHFEGRSWRGFHHHACLVMLAYGFLALEQLREKKEAPASPGSKSGTAPRITLPAIRRALQRLLRPTAKPDCSYCHPHAHVFDRTPYHLTE